MLQLKQRLGPRVRRSVVLTSLWLLFDNLQAYAGTKKPAPPQQDHLSGKSIEADVAYGTRVVDDYFRFGVAEGRVAEIGPGGSAVTALLLLERGADAVELLDRFDYPHNQQQLDRVYATIIQRSTKLRALFSDAQDLGPHITFQTGERAAAELYFREHSGYDAICSRAVLEHLLDPIGALEAMVAALKPGGKLVHFIDFRDHGMYTDGGRHELTFLRIPEFIYRHMWRQRGRPNRALVDQYRAVCARLRLNHEVLVTSLVGVGTIEPTRYQDIPAVLRGRAEARVREIRDRLAVQYRKLEISDLATNGIVLVATRSSATSRGATSAGSATKPLESAGAD